MRVLVRYALILIFVFPPQLRAGEAGRALALTRAVVLSLAVTTGPKLQHAPKELSTAVKKAYLSKPAQVTVNMGHGFLFIITLAGIEMMAQEIRKNGGSLETASRQHLLEVAKSVSHTIVNDGEIWAGLAAAGAGGGVASKSAEAIAAVFANAKLKPRLAKILQHSMVMTIGFLSWEFGSSLWREATLLLGTEADQKRAASMLGMGGAYLRALKYSASHEDAESLRVLRQMLWNMGYVLLFNSDLRDTWVYNSWRHFMTGDVAAMLAGTMAGSAIGTMIFPGGGTVVGAIFGGAGAVGGMFVSEETKDAITIELQSLRQAGSNGSLFLNEGELKKRILDARMVRLASPQAKLESFNEQLIKRRKIRAHYITTGIDRVYLALKQMRPKESAKAATAEETSAVLKDVFAKLDQYHVAETSKLERLSALAEKYATDEYRNVISEEIERVKILKEFLASLSDDLNAELPVLASTLGRTKELPASASSLVKFVEGCHTLVFGEEAIVSKWRALAAESPQ